MGLIERSSVNFTNRLMDNDLWRAKVETTDCADNSRMKRSDFGLWNSDFGIVGDLRLDRELSLENTNDTNRYEFSECCASVFTFV